MRHVLFAPILLLVLSISCITTPTKPDGFFQAVVTCTKDNSQSPQAGAAVLQCHTGAISGNYTVCLSGLVTEGHWAVDEIACLVRAYATSSAVRLNSGTPDASDQVVLDNANAWLRAEQIQFRSVP